MDFTFRKAEEKDVPIIWELIKEAKAGVPESDWFETEDIEYAEKHICEEGFTLLAECKSQDVHAGQKIDIAGLLMVRFPGNQEDNLGGYLNLTQEEMQTVAHLEIAVVSPKYQGNRLQYRLCCEAERILDEEWTKEEISHLMATVHPDNGYSLKNIEKLGMKVIAEDTMYDGKRRFVMWKKRQV